MPSANKFFPVVSVLAVAFASAVPVGLANAAPAGVGSPDVKGPAADYPVVTGDPYVIDGKTYTPANTMNYDAVGYVVEDDQGAGISAAHRTLPLPSYVEVTSLQSGRTILVRVTRRGPMHGDVVLGLSAGAWKQLGLPASARAAIRVRRVNPPEAERALLRLGKTAPERMETPAGLLTVLRRRLGDSDGAMLSGPAQPAPRSATPSATAASGPVSAQAKSIPVRSPSAAAEKLSTTSKANVPVAKAKAKAASAVKSPPAPTPALKPTPNVKAEPGPKARTGATSGNVPAPAAASGTATAPKAKAERAPAAAAKPVASEKAASLHWVVQVATMSTEARAKTVAGKVGGSVSQAGKYWQVRIGPFAERDKAHAALAKARSAGYADATVLTRR